MVMTFFSFWVEQVWGTALMAFIGTGLLYAVLGVMTRMSYMLLFTLLALYGVIFGIGFFGFAVWFPLMLVAFVYFLLGIPKFLRET